MVTALARAGAIGFVLLAGLGCGDRIAAPNPCAGTFDAKVLRSVPYPEINLTGCSFYSVGSGFTVTMSNGFNHVVSLTAGGGRLPTGTHTIGMYSTTTPPPISASVNLKELFSPFFYSESGTLTVLESRAGRFKGSLTMTAKDESVPPVTASVTVSFDATCTPGAANC